MLQLTPELLEKLKKDYWYIFNEYQRKDALQLAQELEREALVLETSNSELFQKCQSFIAQLKWVAFPLMQKDFEMMSLVQNHFLDGLKNEDLDLRKIVTDRGELLFENGSREFLTQLLSALRANQQEIGAEPIMIKGEASLLRPSIKNWLLDYLKNTTTNNPTEIDESNYLFNNPNAKKIKEEDKKILGKVLAFYDTFKYIADQIAQDEMRQMMPIAQPETQQPSYAKAPENRPPQHQPPEQPLPQQQPIPQPVAPPPTPKPMHASRPMQAAPQSPYLEPINETSLQQPQYQAPATTPSQPLSHSDDFDQLRQAPPQYNPFTQQPQKPQSPQPPNAKTSEGRQTQQQPSAQSTPPQPLQQPQQTTQPRPQPQASPAPTPAPPAQFIKDYYSQLAQPLAQPIKPAQPQQQPPAQRPVTPPSQQPPSVQPSYQPLQQPIPQPRPPRPPASQFQPAAPTQTQPPAPASPGYGGPRQNPYLEPIEEIPKKPALQKPPEDRIMGNIIDLKNLDK